MLRVSGIKVKLNENLAEAVERAVKSELKITKKQLFRIKIAKKSVDARKKNDIKFVINADAELSADEDKVLAKADKSRVRRIIPSDFVINAPKKKPSTRPVICGFGPAGMFCALTLARVGLQPIVLERGRSVDERTEAVERFFATGTLDTECNVQFGEGGAGTFSDGKLTCGVNDSRMSYILSQLVSFGAPEDIIYSAKPHIGTDVLRTVVKNIRAEFIRLGGEIVFGARVADIEVKNGAVRSVTYEKDGAAEKIECDLLVMAMGHSARDTFELLYRKGLDIIQKQFSVGVRIEHLQERINRSQYGDFAQNASLGAADYKLACKTESGRGVYTFCMCPGGSVVCASSEIGGVVTNGMSLRARDGRNANSALLCDIYTSDFGSEHPLAGVEFQRRWEKAAFEIGGRNYHAPVTLLGDFMDKKLSTCFGEVEPTYRPATTFAMLDDCLPTYVTEAMRSAIPMLDRKLNGFGARDAIMTGVETRSSSPVRMVRNEHFESNISGLFPCGEGAGYAGGIMSASLDGIRIATEIISRYE